MTRLTVLTVPDPRLKLKAVSVETVDDSVRQLMKDMLETMYAEEGAGLAATQVGIQKRVVVMDIPGPNENEPGTIYKMVNPEIVWESEETCTYNEGCLSVPGQRAEVERPTRVKIRYLDEHNQKQEIDADDFLARCVQHEIDHLDGKLYIDYLTPLKRQMFVKKVQRLLTPVHSPKEKGQNIQ